MAVIARCRSVRAVATNASSYRENAMARHSGILKNAADKQKRWHPNPEAPMDDVNGDFPFRYTPDPERDSERVDHAFMRMSAGILLAIAVTTVVCVMLLFACSAMAHMQDRPDLDAWFNGLQSSGGYPCCSSIDGSTLSDIDWDTTVVDGKIKYRVRLEGQWVVVSDEEVVKAPNRYGSPVVWLYWINLPDGKPKIPQVRCFMPGAGG
jgi:hypothetical protein